MEINTIQSFKKWSEVFDYESDETTVTLLNKQGDPIAEYNYPMFTTQDLLNFKSQP